MPKTQAFENTGTGVKQQYIPKTEVLRFYLDVKCEQELDFSEWRPGSLKLERKAKKIWVESGRNPIFFQMYWNQSKRDTPGEIQVEDVSGNPHLIKMGKHPDLEKLYNADQDPMKYENRVIDPIKHTGRRFYTRLMRLFRVAFAIFFFGGLILGGVDGVRYFSTSKTLYDEMTRLDERFYEASLAAGISLARHEAAVQGYAPAQQLGSQYMVDYNAHLERLQDLQRRDLTSPAQISDVQDRLFRTQAELGEIHSEIGALAGARAADQELLEDVQAQYEHAEQQYMTYTYPMHLRVHYGLDIGTVLQFIGWSD